MSIEIKRVVTKEVEETIEVDLQKYWVVRVIQGVTSYKCVKEVEFMYEPQEQEIASILAEFGNKKCFATVNVNYRLKEQK